GASRYARQARAPGSVGTVRPGQSVRSKTAMLAASTASAQPIAIATCRATGTCQLPQLMVGSRRAHTPSGTARWSKMAYRIGWTTYVSGLAVVSVASQDGRFAIGNRAPDRNIIGMMM